MNISMDDIFEFCKIRIACHVKSLNYFAEILGYQFPEHDSDKNHEPVRTGYAYNFYKKYHNDFNLTPEYYNICVDAQNEHHKHAPHHLQYYKDVSEIPDIRIYEMVCDWASANFEQIHVMHEDCPSLVDWFNQNRAQYNWTKHQLEIIYQSFEKIAENTDENQLKKIWIPLIEKI